MVGVDSDKLVTKADSTENLTVENSTAKNFATAGIRVDYDIFVVVENYYEYFVDCLCQILLQLCALAIGTHISSMVSLQANFTLFFRNSFFFHQWQQNFHQFRNLGFQML